jgi:hydrophobic/amphiphilic exporter-1 (mainly G- bacteria), HAE1 family
MREKSTQEIGEEIKSYVMQIPGVKVRVNPIGIFGTADQTPIQLFIAGTNREDVQTAAIKIAGVLKNIPGTADVRLSSEDGKPETRIDIDRQKMSALGLSIAEVGTALRVALAGDDESKYRDGDNEYDIRIVLDKFDRSEISDLSSLTFVNRKGENIELQQFADVYQTTGPTKLQRRDRISSIIVYSQAVGRPSGSIGEDIRTALAKEELPQGVEVIYEGDLKNQADAFSSLGLALIAAFIFVYLVMVALYNSYVYPFVVLFSIPVAMVGALFALALTMNALSIFSLLGIIMLIGLVGKNAILLVDRANAAQLEGMNVYDALIEAGRTRIRPIIMTTATMVIGMLPIALSASSGSEWKSGLAWALVGGLTSSMFLTLILVPVVYTYAEGWKERFPVFFRKIFRNRDREEYIPEPEVR